MNVATRWPVAESQRLSFLDNDARQALGVSAWLFDLDADEPNLPEFSAVLPASELAHAGRLRDPLQGRRFLGGRRWLRLLLAGVTDMGPESLVLTTSRRGKLGLATETLLAREQAGIAHSLRHLGFNISHCENLLLAAINMGGAVGVDVERVDATAADLPQIASDHFLASEVAQLQALPPADLPTAFFRCWTLKEAAAKALGQGIAQDANLAELTVDPYGGVTLRRLAGVVLESRTLGSPAHSLCWQREVSWGGRQFTLAIVALPPATA